jgi:hypothetical protein
MSTLYLDIDAGRSIYVGKAKVTVEKKTGRKVRLRIDADSSVCVTQDGGHIAQKKPIAQEG